MVVRSTARALCHGLRPPIRSAPGVAASRSGWRTASSSSDNAPRTSVTSARASTTRPHRCKASIPLAYSSHIARKVSLVLARRAIASWWLVKACDDVARGSGHGQPSRLWFASDRRPARPHRQVSHGRLTRCPRPTRSSRRYGQPEFGPARRWLPAAASRRDLEDIFAVQNDIIREIVVAMDVQSRRGEQHRFGG